MAYKYAKSGTPKLEEIELGARICKTIKNGYFPDKDWGQSCNDVANLLTSLKVVMRKMCPDLTEIQRLIELSNYTIQDIMDILPSK